MNTPKTFNHFAEEIVSRLKNVPFQELNSYEGQEFTWKKGRQQGSVSVSIEIVSAQYKRVTVDGMVPGSLLWFKGHSFSKSFRAYESGVRIPELQD